MKSLSLFAFCLAAFAQTAPAPISTVPVPNPPQVPQFTMLAAGTVYDQLQGWRAWGAGLLPVSKGFWFSVTAIVTTEHLNSATGNRVIAPSSDIWVEGYKSLYTGKKVSLWIGSGLRVNVSASGAVSSLSGSTGLNPPISTVVRYAFSSRWALLVGTRTTFISPPSGSTAKGYWDFAPAIGAGYNIP